MADKEDFAIQATPSATAAIESLRGTARKSYEAFEAELRKQGCKVAGYRLLGPEEGGYSEYCCKRLVDDWRVIATFEPGTAIIVAVGRHDDSAFYADLAKTYEIGPVGQRREEKPACCGEGGWPSVDSTSAERKCGERSTSQVAAKPVSRQSRDAGAAGVEGLDAGAAGALTRQ